MKTRLNKTTAKGLATRYAAYLDAFERCDDSGIVVWGSMLREAQAETGIAMLSDALIRACVEGARRRLDADKAKVALADRVVTA